MSLVPRFTFWAMASVSSACASDEAGCVVEHPLRHRERDRGAGRDPLDDRGHRGVEARRPGSTAFTKPSSAARAALIISAVSASSFALWMPMRCARNHEVP